VVKRANNCIVSQCDGHQYARRFCRMHYSRWLRHGDPLIVISPRGKSGTGHITTDGYKVVSVNGRSVFEHVLVAEQVYGGSLPKGAIVHHVNEVRDDNRPENLLICSRAYHVALHTRMRARAACGNPDWVRCWICKTYDDPKRMYVHSSGSGSWHRHCFNGKYLLARRSEYRHRKRLAAAPASSKANNG